MQKKKISIAQVIVFVISFVLAYFAAQYFFSKNDSTPNAMLLETTAEMNRSMPKMMDAILNEKKIVKNIFSRCHNFAAKQHIIFKYNTL